MTWMSDPTIWASLLTLTLLEIVLGIDNVIFVSIVELTEPIVSILNQDVSWRDLS